MKKLYSYYSILLSICQYFLQYHFFSCAKNRNRWEEPVGTSCFAFLEKSGWRICTFGCVNKGYLTHRRRQQELHSRQIAENSKRKQQHHTDTSQNPFKPAIFLQPFRMPDNADEKQRPPEKDQPCHSNVFLYSAGNVKMQQSYKKMGDAASGAGKLCDSLEQAEEMKWSELDQQIISKTNSQQNTCASPLLGMLLPVLLKFCFLPGSHDWLLLSNKTFIGESDKFS